MWLRLPSSVSTCISIRFLAGFISPICAMKSVISNVEPLSFPFKTLDPFLFCVYHKDNYPAGDGKMQAPRRGNGADFDPNADYRMYHGDRIPGFPQHPHRGFETITATTTGLIDHTDSCGNAGRYGHGDLQWMTAGKGVVHGEMFPLINSDSPNPLKLFQIWINLPKKNKFADPAFTMHWAESVPTYQSPDGKAKLTIWAGSYGEQKALQPPPDSYASQPSSDVGVFFIELAPRGGTFTLPAAAGGRKTNRCAYFVEGASLEISGESVRSKSAATLLADQDAVFRNTHSSLTAEILVLQGRPIGEPIVQHGPFVMNTAQEIQQAFQDYRRTQFGGWPWPKDAMVFPVDKGRFSLLNGKEERPPVTITTANGANEEAASEL